MADIPKAGSGIHRVPGSGPGRLAETCGGSEAFREVSPERSRPALEALPGQRRGRDGAEAAARSWWVRLVRSPGGAPVPLSGVSVPSRPSGAPAAGAGRGGAGAGSPQAQALPPGWGPGKGETSLRAAGALRGLGAPARFGSCWVLCQAPGGVVFAQGGPGLGVPPVPLSAGPGARRVPALPPRGFTGPARPSVTVGRGRACTRSSPALCRGNAYSETCISCGCLGTSLKLEAARKKRLVLAV